MKKLIIALVAALCISVAISAAAVTILPKEEDLGESTLYFVEPEDGTPYLVKKYDNGTVSDEPMNVISFTDTHLNEGGTSNTDIITLTIIDRVVEREKPDLVVFTGDVCLGTFAPFAIEKLGEIFAEHEVFWAVVLGNHDGEGTGIMSRHDLIEKYSQQKFCLTELGPDTIYGFGNYIVNLKNSKGIYQSLVFMDSGDYTTTAKCEQYGFDFADGYDFIKPDQIEWYKDSLAAIKTENGGVMPNSSLFIHIPLVEYDYAYDHLSDPDVNLNFGKGYEAECCSPINSGMFDAIQEVGSTKTVVCGHDHVNDYSVTYKGVNLMYSASSSFGSYYARKHALVLLDVTSNPDNAHFCDGHTQYDYAADGSVKISHAYNQDNPYVFVGLKERFETLGVANTLPEGIDD